MGGVLKMLLSANANIVRINELRELGYDAIDVGLTRVIYHDDPHPHDPILDDELYEERLSVYLEECKKIGLQINSTHLPYKYNFANEELPEFEYCHTMTVRALKASEFLGAKWAVMHPRNFDDTVAYVKRLFEESGVQNIGLALENGRGTDTDGHIQLVDYLQSEGYRVGVCLDVGHCHASVNGYDVADTVRKYGERIKVLHIHDNCTNLDAHRAPYMGTIKWDGVMKALKEIGFAGDFNFELQPKRIPESARMAYERYCVDIGRHLISLYDKY